MNNIKGETTIYGKVLMVTGADNPKIMLKIFDKILDYTVDIKVTKPQVLAIALRLYQDVGLTGIALWDRDTYKILDFKKVSKVIMMDNKPLSKTFEELRKLYDGNETNWEEII